MRPILSFFHIRRRPIFQIVKRSATHFRPALPLQIWRMMRMLFVDSPIGWVNFNVFLRSPPFLFITNDAFPVVSQPQLFFECRPVFFPHAPNIKIRRQRFKRLHHTPQRIFERPRRGEACLRPPVLALVFAPISSCWAGRQGRRQGRRQASPLRSVSLKINKP